MARLNYGTKMFLMCGSVIVIGTAWTCYLHKKYLPPTLCSLYFGPISEEKKLELDRIMQEAEAAGRLEAKE